MADRTVWKFQLDDPQSTFDMPAGAVILHVAEQPYVGRPMIWALVDPERPPEARTFVVLDTGKPLPDEVEQHVRYIGTWLEAGGVIVQHLFELIPRSPVERTFLSE